MTERNYGCEPGQVYIDLCRRPDVAQAIADLDDSWKTISISEVQPNDFIIPCVDCEEPAIHIDHHWPFMSGHNRCANCAWAEGLITRERRTEHMLEQAIGMSTRRCQ